MGGRKASRLGRRGGGGGKGALPIPDPCAPWVTEGSSVGRVPQESWKGDEGAGGGHVCARSRSVLFEAALKVSGANVAAPHRALDVLLKQASVVLEDFGSLFVQGVFRVWLLGRKRDKLLNANTLVFLKKNLSY